uniref:Immunity-related GTPase family, e4 n=1 Tax=Hucho hucho TaxID=62062 RepID=A0A4W5PIC2_9TELE
MSDENLYEDLDIVKEIKNYNKFTPTENAAIAKEHLDLLENVTLKIAVTRETESPPLLMPYLDEGAAETGVTETTMKPIRYSHHTMPNKYLKEVKIKTYNFFIIIGTVRFKGNDIMLAKEMRKMKMIKDRQQHPSRGMEEELHLLSKIRQNCEENLKTVGNPKVFLISTFELGKYDFQKLIDSLEENLSEHKRSALIQSLKYIFKTAFAAAAGASTTAAVPIPGFSVDCEIGVMQAFFHKAFITFGLDEKSLQRLSELRMHTTAMVAAKAIEAVLTTVVFTFGAIGIAFATTLHLLHEGIKEMVEGAKAVLMAAGLE